MKISVMQPYLFPSVSYFQLMKSVDTFVLFDDVAFIKKGWVNRNYFGDLKSRYMFTVPLSKPSQNKNINEHHIVMDGTWEKKFLKKINLLYSRKDEFEPLYLEIENIIRDSSGRKISELIYDSILKLNQILDIGCKIIKSSDLDNNKSLRGQDKIIDICTHLKGTQYINAIGGKDLYSETDFHKSGLDLFFVQSEFESLIRNDMRFSIIDTLFYFGVEETKRKVDQYEIIKKEFI